MNGELVKEIFSETQTSGEHTYAASISSIAPGIYFLQLKTGNDTVTRKISVQ